MATRIIILLGFVLLAAQCTNNANQQADTAIVEEAIIEEAENEAVNIKNALEQEAEAQSAALQSVGNVLYLFQDLTSPVLTFVFLIGATCLYISFYRTRLIPRWLTIWGLIGVVFYFAYALSQFFHLDTGYEFYLQMVLAPQELVMGAWLVIKGFNLDAVKKLDEAD